MHQLITMELNSLEKIIPTGEELINIGPPENKYYPRGGKNNIITYFLLKSVILHNLTHKIELNSENKITRQKYSKSLGMANAGDYNGGGDYASVGNQRKLP